MTFMNLTQRQRLSAVEDSLGKPYSKLTVDRFVSFRQTPRGANVPMVECSCECGNKKVVSLWDVRSGKTKSCGFDHPHYTDRSLPAFNNLFKNAYRARALRDGLQFELSAEQFRHLTQLPCHYCGCAPSTTANRTTGGRLSQYVYNGLDRKDSTKGYTSANVVPCCGTCNHAKHTMSYERFVAWIDRLVAFRCDGEDEM